MKQRIITAFIALLIFVPILIYGKLPFIILTYLMASIGLFELLRMRNISISSFPAIITLIFLWFLLLPNTVELSLGKTEIVIFYVIIMLFYTVLSKNRFSFDEVGFTLIAMLYLTMGFLFFMETRLESLAYVFYLLVIVWSTDTGAYFTGRALGKHKLWPDISPNKTIEGAIGGIVFACVFGLVFQLIYPLPLPKHVMLTATIFLSMAGQIGDLVASAYKRHYDVKDSGKLLPGHGGILDRMDSLLFVFPIFHIIYVLL
ncbi:MAG TPA: phosphatidate cytidylyltransferase [Cerasibacillus sp.]|uniref:phosphatidate cytidylyltransferase n=1 Tax=Cerasibacillus sp. TaxID=2498711 RepID=UPI002F42F11A